MAPAAAKKTWSIPDAFSSGLALLALSGICGIGGFSIKREIDQFDKERGALLARVEATEARNAIQSERLARIEESFRYIVQELQRITANVDRNNQKFDKILSQNH